MVGFRNRLPDRAGIGLALDTFSEKRRKLMKKRLFALILTLLLVLAACLFSVSPVMAAPPANDNFVNAVVISSLPYTNSVDTTEATLQAGEPIPSIVSSTDKTVWYTCTSTASVSLSASVTSGFLLAVYTGSVLS